MNMLGGRILKLVLHYPDGQDVEVPTEKIRAAPGFWATTMPGTKFPIPMQFWRLAPLEDGGDEIWYGGAWSAQWSESRIAVPNGVG